MNGPQTDEGPRGERSLGRQLGSVAIAIAAGVVLAVLAPQDWPAGRGTVSVTVAAQTAVQGEVEIGSIEPTIMRGTAGDLDVEIVFADGIPDDEPIKTTIEVTRQGAVVQPAIEDIAIRLELADGRSELIPVIRWDGTEGRHEALRRPSRDAPLVLGLLGLVVVLWVTEAFPLFVTSLLIPVGLVMTGVGEATEATSPFFNPIIVLFFAGFLMAEAMRRTELDHYVAVTITALTGRNALSLFATMLGVTAFLSMWMSNTAAAAVLIPIALAITAPLAEKQFQRVLVLGIAYAATLGGVGSAIGTPANQLAIEFLGEFGGRSISFVGWFAYGVPMVLIMLPVIGAFLWLRAGVRVDRERFANARRVAVEERQKQGNPNGDQLIVLAIFGLVAFGWVTQTFHGVHAGLVALAGAVALFVVGKLRPDDLGRISWPALLTFGGGLTLGLFLVKSGTSDFVATRLTGLTSVSTLVATGVVASVTLLLTTVASNTASAAILIPLAIPLAGVLGLDPTTLVVVVAIASSIDFALVIGTPPTMIAYSTRLYTAGQIFRTGILLDVAGIAVLVLIVIRVWELVGLV